MYRFPLLVVAFLATCLLPSPTPGCPQEQLGNRSADEFSSTDQSRVDALIESARAKELAGDNAERDRILNEAVAIAGTRYCKLNSLRGLVLENGQWMTPTEVARQSSQNEALAKYHSIRQKSQDNLVGNWELARWCQRSGLENQARAHLLRALDFEIDNARVRDRLGHVNIGNRWITPEQIQAANEEAEAAQQLLAKHRDETKEILRLLDSQSKKKRAEGLERLGQVNDPEWIIPLELVFMSLNEEIAQVAIERLASFDERESTQALMRISVYHPWPAVRELAANRLGTREPSEYVPDLIGMLATPVTSQFSIQTNRTGGLLYQHLFTQQTNEKEIVRLTGANMIGAVDSGDARQAMGDATSRARRMEYMKEIYNRGVEDQNQVVIGVLSRALNLDLGSEPTAWWDWWNEHNEVYVASRPVSYDSEIETISLEPRLPRSYECLVAGTKVWTSTGLVPIEQLTVGDRVLARDDETGTLSYRPVIRPTVRPASPTVEIKLHGDVIRASGGHPFWVTGEGWVRARDLTPEMRLQTTNGSVPVLSVTDSTVVELYNLVVDKDANYFVGDLGVLSHDNTIPSKPTKTLRNREAR